MLPILTAGIFFFKHAKPRVRILERSSEDAGEKGVAVVLNTNQIVSRGMLQNSEWIKLKFLDQNEEISGKEACGRHRNVSKNSVHGPTSN